jgi:hypothetical protein
MALIDRSVVKVYQEKFKNPETLTVLKGVLFETSNTENNLVEIGSAATKPLSNENIFKLHFGVDTFIYVDLNNGLEDYYKGETDVRTGLDLTYLVLSDGEFRMPAKDALSVSPPFKFDKLKYFLEGLTEEKIKALSGNNQNIIDEFNSFKDYQTLRTESGSKITFIQDPDYAAYNAAAHSITPPTTPPPVGGGGGIM